MLLPADRTDDLDRDVVPVDDDTAHHLARVLRVRDGQLVTVTDGAGRWRECRARASGRRDVEVSLVAAGEVTIEQRPTPPLTIATAIPKGDRIEWLVQKATECGADHLVLVDCERSVVRWPQERRVKQLGRLQRIADEATRQSRRVVRTTIAGVVPATDVLRDAVVAEPGAPPIDARHHTIAVGPEGGWSPAELELAGGRVGLGPHVLRTETAVVAAVTLSVVVRHRSLGFSADLN